MTEHLKFDSDTERREFWQGHVIAWKNSGLSQNEYCREQGIKKSPLSYWKHKLVRATSIPRKRNRKEAMFVEVSPSTPGRRILELVVHDDLRIELSLNLVGDLRSLLGL